MIYKFDRRSHAMKLFYWHSGSGKTFLFPLLGHLLQAVHFMTPRSELSASQGNSSNQLVWNALLHFVESYSLLSKGFRFVLCALLPDFSELKSLMTNLPISYGLHKMAESIAESTFSAAQWPGLWSSTEKNWEWRLEEDDARSVNMAIETKNWRGTKLNTCSKKLFIDLSMLQFWLLKLNLEVK